MKSILLFMKVSIFVKVICICIVMILLVLLFLCTVHSYNVTILDRFMTPRVGSISGTRYDNVTLDQCATQCLLNVGTAFSYSSNTCYVGADNFVKNNSFLLFTACIDFSTCTCLQGSYLHERRERNGCYNCTCQPTLQDP